MIERMAKEASTGVEIEDRRILNGAQKANRTVGEFMAKIGYTPTKEQRRRLEYATQWS